METVVCVRDPRLRCATYSLDGTRPVGIGVDLHGGMIESLIPLS